jgi:hypothetical protein
MGENDTLVGEPNSQKGDFSHVSTICLNLFVLQIACVYP